MLAISGLAVTVAETVIGSNGSGHAATASGSPKPAAYQVGPTLSEKCGGPLVLDAIGSSTKDGIVTMVRSVGASPDGIPLLHLDLTSSKQRSWNASPDIDVMVNYAIVYGGRVVAYTPSPSPLRSWSGRATTANTH